MDRRGFLTGAFARRGAEASESPTAAQRAAGAVLAIGGWADFPAGTRRRLEGAGLEIDSRPEGIRARTLGVPARWLAVSEGPAGALRVDTKVEWPPDRACSSMTGGPVRLEGTWEDTE